MNIHRTIAIVSAALALTLAVPLTATKNGDDVIVNFGDPVTLAGAANQVVIPDEVTIGKGGTVTFVVNGPGHGIAIYPISDNTTRDDITAQLCAHDLVTNQCNDATFANGDHTTLDAKNNLVITTGTNPPLTRVDDPTDRLLATSTQIDGLPGAFLSGTGSTTGVTHLQFRFTKTGRYLVICMNRNHYLNNWMFGFVTVGA